MTLYTTFFKLSPNARFGAVALMVGGVLFGGFAWVDGAAPLRIFAMAALLFGQLCYAQEAGYEKPLTKFVLVWLFIAAVGLLMFEALAAPKAALLFAFAGFAAVLVWSIAMLHRPGQARAAGKIGAFAGVTSLAVLIGGHVFVGFGAALGLQALSSAATAQTADVVGIVRAVESMMGLWALAGAWMLFAGVLNAD